MRVVPCLLICVAAAHLACIELRYPSAASRRDAGVPDASADTGTLSGTLVVPSTITAAGSTGHGGSAIDGGIADVAAPIAKELKRAFSTERFVGDAAKQKGRGVIAGSKVIAGDVLVRFEERNVKPELALETLRVDGLRCEHGGYASEYLHRVRCLHADGTELETGETLELISKLRGRPGIRFVAPNNVVQAQAIPNDSFYAYQWHYPMMNLEAAWDVTTGSPSIVVAVIDTGIISHPDLDPNVLWGIDLVSDAARSGDGDGRDDNPHDPGKDGPNGSSSWHGTHVAGTIAAASNNSFGVAGVAWNARILPVRVLGRGGGSDFDIAAGIAWAAGLNVPGVRMNSTPAHVLNMSLGGEGAPSPVYQDVIDAAVDEGAVVVVAAGNADIDGRYFVPCNQDQVICVGALGPAGNMTQYSNFGAVVDVVAPGGDVATDMNNDNVADGVLSTLGTSTGAPAFGPLQGTSMAAPHVAGVAALMKSMNPAVTHAQVEALLRSTANPAYKCPAGCGAGLVDARAAVVSASGATASGPAKLVVTALTLQLLDNQRSTIGITNAGGQTLNVTASVEGELEGRISFEPGTSGYVGPGKSGGLVLIPDATGLADGEYTSLLILESNGGAAYVKLVLTVGASQTQRAGMVAAVFQDDRGDWQLAGYDVTGANEGFGWTIDVAAGTYLLVGTIDADSDGKYFEDGEPFGVFRDLQNPVAVSVSRGQRVQELGFMIVPASQLGEVDSVFGDACSSNDVCGGGEAYCAQWPGGYCTRKCTSSNECGAGSACVEFPNADAFCLATCTSGSQCRSGYSCYEVEGGVGVCLPE